MAALLLLGGALTLGAKVKLPTLMGDNELPAVPFRTDSW